MASATVDSTTDYPLQLDSISTVDLHLLSQSELYALSLCSDGAFDPRRCDDVVIPKIDRSVFNESAGSRKQTYSRLRLAPAASSAAIRHRTPHLRSPKRPPYISNDPEKAENSQIVNLLKELFTADAKFSDLVQIPVEFRDSVPEFSNLGNNYSGGKRKRGRPRKDEIAAPAVVAAGGGDAMKDIVVYENVEDVDLEALAGLEDPFGPEIRRRTEGLVTKEELLGFLEGLNGQWGTRRKKKKIVDASEFGDALPRGWKLLISVKQKEGRVWLFCRRYISPNGRQFVSCKEVSSHLRSIFGLQDPNLPNCAQSNDGIQFSYKVDSVNAADLSVLEDNKKENTVCNSSPPITSISRNHEKQVTLKIEDPVEVQVGDILMCDKCTMTFGVKDDLLHQQLSSQRRKRSKIGTSIAYGVIIESGQYDCQFCHKTFNERNHCSDNIGADSDVVVENVDVNANDELNPDSPCSKYKAGLGIETYTDGFDHDFNFSAHDKQDLHANRNEKHLSEESKDKQDRDSITSYSKVGGVEEAMDIVVAKYSLCLGSEAALSKKEKGSYCESFVETNVIECAANKISECFDGEEKSLESCLPSPFPEELTCGFENNVIGVSASVDELNQEAVSESSLLAPNINEKTSGIQNMDDRHVTMDEFKLDSEKFVKNGSISGFCIRHAGLDEDSATEVKQCTNSEGDMPLPSENEQFSSIDNVNGVTSSITAEAKQKRDSESSSLTPSADEETCAVEDNVNRVSTSSIGPQVDGIYNFGSSECISYARPDIDAVISLEEKHLESCSLVSSWCERVRVIENYGNEVSTCTVDESRQQKGSESSLLSLHGFQQNCGVENHVDEVYTRKMEEPKLNEVQTLRNSELIDPFGNSQRGPNADFVTSIKERSFEFCSLVPSGNEQTFGVQGNVSGVYSSAVGEHKQQNCETSDNVNNVNKIYSMPMDELKFGVVRNSGIHELSLAFENPHAGLYADANSIEQEKYPANCSAVPSVIEQTFGIQPNLSRLHNSMVETPKHGRGSVGSIFSLSFNGEDCGFENNFNTVYSDGVWEGPKVDEVGNSENKFMIGFGSNRGQLDEDMPGGIWRTGKETALQSGLADASNSLVQSSNCFRNLDIVTDKVEDGLFRLNEKYDRESAFEGLRSGRTEPVEFSFLTTQNSNTLQGDSKVFSYDAEMEQFDSSFWLGKNALMPNIGSRNQVAAVCVWCGCEFRHEPVPFPSGTQAAIGSMCPTCRARI